MPKMKTKKSAAKRFKKTGSGKIMRFQGGNRHLSSKKPSKRKRRLRKNVVLDKSVTKRTKQLI